MKNTLTLNNSSVNFSSAALGGALSINSVTSNVGVVIPIQIASAAAANGSSAVFGVVGAYTVSLAVGTTPLVSSQLAVAGVASSPLGRMSHHL